MVEQIERPQKADGSLNFILPDATRARITTLFQERQVLETRISEIIQTAMEANGLVAAETPNYDLATGVVSYQPVLAPVPINRKRESRR